MSTTITPTSIATVRVLSVPAAHPYVRAVTADPRVTVLADPPVPGARDGQWWPPQALRTDWIAAHAGDADVLHIHFGTESFEPAELVAAVDAAHRNGWPVVYTVHDLENPQLSDQSTHRDLLDALVPRADAVLTLTPGAATEIRQRWYREATVLPHPHLLGDDIVLVDPAPHETAVIGLELKDLRPNIDAVAATHAVLDAVGELSASGIPARADVRMHRSVRDPETREAVRRLVAGTGGELIEHDRFDDTTLARSLSALDAVVLPYAYGTHSGWLELCWDLGVPVAVPRRGYYAQQHDDSSVATFDEGSLTSALAGLLRGPRAGTAERALLRASRHGERRAVDPRTAQSHADLYARLLAERPRP
ncbi:glycosyltransferase [Microbacteriaceae bacterium VKM Ac-2855]|nr:glycosyltransferase [Microbacteriaceae bacterium VKM Ac-2855]